MGLFSKDIQTFDDLFLHTLQDITTRKIRFVKSLPEMIENTTNAQFKQGLQNHLGETQTHVKRLEQVFQMLGKSAKGVDCPAIDGIIEEAQEVSGEVADKNVLDAAIIAAGPAVEHYEITRHLAFEQRDADEVIELIRGRSKECVAARRHRRRRLCNRLMADGYASLAASTFWSTTRPANLAQGPDRNQHAGFRRQMR